MRKTREDWLHEGLHTIAELGASELKIDVLTARLGVTKGSFYHHFKNYDDYKIQLLAYFEQGGTRQIIEQVEQLATPADKLDKLLALTLTETNGLEVGLRAWALQDEEVGRFQARIDGQRLAYVQQLCQTLGYDQQRATMMSHILYALYIGSGQVMPPLTAVQRQALYNEFKRMYLTGGNHDPF